MDPDLDRVHRRGLYAATPPPSAPSLRERTCHACRTQWAQWLCFATTGVVVFVVIAGALSSVGANETEALGFGALAGVMSAGLLCAVEYWTDNPAPATPLAAPDLLDAPGLPGTPSSRSLALPGAADTD